MKNLLFMLLLLTVLISQAFSVAFDERKPHDEKVILVPKGAQPMLKEEYPRSQLVVDRIRARHSQVLVIPFARSWNTAAFTAVNGIQIEENPETAPNNFELGFALHSQRLRVGALTNREYFQKETEGFPEGRYQPVKPMNLIDRSQGYMSTSFVHLAAKRIHREYIDYCDFEDRVSGMLNAITEKKVQLTLMARRDMQDMQSISSEGVDTQTKIIKQPKVRNTASISYNTPVESKNRFNLCGGSIWSTLTDSAERDFRYISGLGSAAWNRDLRPDFNLELKSELQISTFRDKIRENTGNLKSRTLETRKSGLLEVSNTFSPAGFLKLRLNVATLYDSEYKGYFMPGAELALIPKMMQTKVGIRRQVILPDRDELYWTSKLVKVNDDLKPVDFWETYGSINVNVITRLTFLVEASYSRPESRISWEQLRGYVWTPVNEETSEAFTGEASMVLNLIGNLSTFAGFRYQRFDNQFFEPEIIADAGIYYGRSTSGSITLGGSFWNFQPFDTAESPEELVVAYIRINKSIHRTIGIFIDGRYTIDREDVVYYRGIPQAGRIISFGANIVFGGLD